MSFSKEEEMYPIIRKFLESEFDCKAVEEKTRFTLLKGWRIDVAGIVKENGTPRIISVEAKNGIGPYTVLQGISQAEMYQKVATIVYLAFPEEKIYHFKKRNEKDWARITNLCKSKGIGILSVKENDCEIVEKALELPQNIDTYYDVIDQIEEQTIEEFEGFTNRDFDYFLEIEDGRRKIVKRKIEHFLGEVRDGLLKKCTDFPYIDPRKLKVEIGRFQKNSCWCFISQEKKRDLPYYAHYTVGIDGLGVDIVVNMETDKSVNNFIHNVQGRKDKFLILLRELTTIDSDYELKIWERIPPLWDWSNVSAFNTGHIDNEVLDQILKVLNTLKHSVVRLVCPKYFRGNKSLYTKVMVDEIIQRVGQMQEFYGFLRS